MLEGEPKMKRSVEGDLGVYVNRVQVLETFREDEMMRIFKMNKSSILEILKNEPFIPTTEKAKMVIDLLTSRCVELAIDRHAGDLKRIFTTNGYKVIPEGKDLSQVKAIFLTGGALLHMKKPEEMIRHYLQSRPTKLVPDEHVDIYLDKDYIFASLGVLSRIYPDQAKQLITKSIRKVGDVDVS
jgi:uncharacterized protein (TIGR01319 family)